MTGPIAQSAAAISRVLRDFFTADGVASKAGFLQQRDLRVLVFSITGLALTVMITRTVAVPLVVGGLTAFLAWRSRVPLDRLAKRLAIVPVASTVMVLPQAVVVPGHPVAQGFWLTVSDAGLTYVLQFGLRVGVGVSLLSLLVMTTPFADVIAAMRDARVPAPLVWIIAITYRYLFLFFDELRRLVLARNSRTTGGTDACEGWRNARRMRWSS